jgi:hypothetical protein
MKSLSLIVLAASTLLGSVPARAAVEVDARVQEMERYLEAKLQRHLDQLFPRIPLTVSVKIKTDDGTAKKNEKKKEGDSGAFVDLGYIPFPVELSPDEAAASTPTTPRGRIKIEATQVFVQADARVSDGTLEQVRESLTAALDGYAPQVSVRKLGKEVKPGKGLASEGGAAVAGGGGGNVFERRVQSESDVEQREQDRKNRLLTSAVQAGGFFLLALAIFFLALFVRRAFGALADSIKALGGKAAAAAGGGLGDASVDGTLNLGGAASALGIKLPLEEQGAAFRRNHAAFREALEQKPEILAQELQATPEDADGLRWLLPTLKPEEQESLRKWLGPAKTRQLLAMAGTSAGDANDLLEARHRWLQHFVERVALRRVRGGSMVEAAVGAEMALQISAISVQDIETWLQDRTDAGAWRLAAEFIPAERFSRMLDRMEGDRWVMLADAAEASDKDLAAAAKDLVDSKREKNPEVARKAEVRKDYFTRVLVDPLVAALKKRPLSEQEGLLEQFEASHPDLVEVVSSRFWSVRQVDRVPKDFLEKSFRALGTEEKVAVMASVPDALARKFRAWIPEGNVRLIIEDRVAKIHSRKDKKELAAITETAQQFVETLRLANISGAFDLEPAGGASKDTQSEAPLRRAS